MSYNETIGSMEYITKFAESIRPMIDEMTKYIPTTIARMSKQMSESVMSIPYKQIVKNFQPVFSQSTMQAITKIQREQIANLSKQIVEINKMSLLVSQSEITIDEPDELIDEEAIVPTTIETKAKHLITWENASKFMQYLIKKFLEICVVEPFLKSLFDDFLLPIFFKIWKWFLWNLSQLW